MPGKAGSPRVAAAAKRPYFTCELFSFLSDLGKHNERDWFERNKLRYEAVVRDPVLRFIGDIGPGLAKISPHFVADTRPVGGSMMRIYRDIRFSKDKSPYKTAIGMHFWHQTDKNGAAPAFYLRLEPKGCVAGGGIWRPGGNVLGKIRDAIAADSKAWTRATVGRSFRSNASLVGESLKRVPPGYDPDHPCIDDIKRQDFAASVPLRDEQVTDKDFMNVLLDMYRAIAPLMQFLSKALKLQF